jgi:hypothetical protein
MPKAATEEKAGLSQNQAKEKSETSRLMAALCVIVERVSYTTPAWNAVSAMIEGNTLVVLVEKVDRSTGVEVVTDSYRVVVKWVKPYGGWGPYLTEVEGELSRLGLAENHVEIALPRP